MKRSSRKGNSQLIDIRQREQDTDLGRCSLIHVKDALWKGLIDIFTLGECFRMTPEPASICCQWINVNITFSIH